MSMTKEAVKDKMKDPNASLLNVLTASEFASLHIAGSENLPLGSNVDDFIHSVEKRFGKDRFIITYCAGGPSRESSNATKALQKRGFRSDDYPGGNREWSEAGFPMEGDDMTAKTVPPVAPAKVAPKTVTHF